MYDQTDFIFYFPLIHPHAKYPAKQIKRRMAVDQRRNKRQGRDGLSDQTPYQGGTKVDSRKDTKGYLIYFFKNDHLKY